MGPNMWRANHGYFNTLPPPFVAGNPYYPGPPMYFFSRKPPKRPMPRPVPVCCTPGMSPHFGPTPYPPSGASHYATAGAPCQCYSCCGCAAGASDSDGYKPIPHSGQFIPLHIMRRGTTVDEIINGSGHYFRVPSVDFVQRSYQDNLSFKQFMLDFAGKGDWIVTQVREAGDGKWDKVFSIDVSSDKGKKTMADVGWTSGWGPVWVVIERKKE